MCRGVLYPVMASYGLLGNRFMNIRYVLRPLINPVNFRIILEADNFDDALSEFAYLAGLPDDDESSIDADEYIMTFEVVK